MADMHVMTGDGEKWTIVMHIAVPNTDNSVGMNHRSALMRSEYGVVDGRRTILPEGNLAGQITAAEEALLDSGALYEHVGTFMVESGSSSNAELRASIREFYAREKDTVQDRLATCLRYFGHTESAS